MARLIEQILLMCAIVGLSPVEVDCDNQWVLVQDSGIFLPVMGTKGLSAYDIDKFPITDFYPDVEEKYQNKRWMAVADLKQDNCWNDEMTDEPTNCIPLIWHEIKHQVCTCNWHENLVKTFKSFKGAFGGI